MFRHAEATGAALVIATHDASVAERMPLRWTITGRRLHTGAPCMF
jgi:predicted ABC-type transport system involved in lysophospholipase L1 biosynthesis ATPase subunit